MKDSGSLSTIAGKIWLRLVIFWQVGDDCSGALIIVHDATLLRKENTVCLCAYEAEGGEVSWVVFS